MRIEMEDEMSLKQCLCLCAFTHFEQTCQLLFMCGAASLNENTGQREQSETDGKKRREERRVIYVGNNRRAWEIHLREIKKGTNFACS